MCLVVAINVGASDVKSWAVKISVEMEEGRGGKVKTLIELATNSTAPEVDPRLLKSIKALVRSSDLELQIAAQTLMDLIKRDHSQIRYLSLLIIDELFMRSKLFRSILVVKLDQILSLSVGFKRNQPLPAPPAVASVLRSKAIEFLEKWNASFGIHYRQIRLGFDYLKNTLRLQFPNIQANASRIQQERREREIRSKAILLNKYETLKVSFSSIKDEIQSTVDQIGECLDIVQRKDENEPFFSLNDEVEDFNSSALRQIRLDALKEGEKIREDNDNKVVFDALRELYRLLVSRHLVSVQEWISVLIRVEMPDNRLRDSMLKEFIDIRNRLKSVKKKCEEAGCFLSNTTENGEEEEGFWEEGTIEPFQSGNSSAPNKHNDALSTASTSIKVEPSNKEWNDNEMPGREGGGTDSSSPRRNLLNEAPVVKWGSFLDHWGSDRDFMINQRGMELDNHWGRVDYNATIPAYKIAELNAQTTIYKEEHVEIQPCRAPLSKGGLCKRRDLNVCPFHGPIIDRDDEGKPIIQNSSTDEMDFELGTDLVDQLAKQAVKNVRERDKKEAEWREYDKKSLKRAKLAKVREHNNVVIREAALASTSRSSDFGEAMDATNNKKKQTLASMLRKKVTPKDRLAQRLLNTRARDATTRQLTMGEDTNYRENFPNQW